MPATFPSGQLRTLQHRVKQWRTDVARRLVLGAGDEIDDGIPTITESEKELLK
jgi:hypothetical protein